MSFTVCTAVLSILGYLLKAPAVPPGAPVINALSKQRAAIGNILRACVGLQPVSDIGLEFKLPEKCREMWRNRSVATEIPAVGDLGVGVSGVGDFRVGDVGDARAVRKLVGSAGVQNGTGNNQGMNGRG